LVHGPREVGQESRPARDVPFAKLCSLRDPIPAAVHDRYEGSTGSGLEDDPYFGSLAPVSIDVPEILKPAGWIPHYDFTQSYSIPSEVRSKIRPPAPRLESDGEIGVAGAGMGMWPPQRRARRPQIECVRRIASDLQGEDDGVPHLVPRPRLVFSAASLKRAAASPHTLSR
jgi:hypothetical protein